MSDSPLIQETIELLRSCGGALSVTEIADAVLRISQLEDIVARPLVGAMIDGDPRLCLRADGSVELCETNAEARLLHETDFVVVDVETTGAKSPPGRITEVGAYRIRQGRITDEWQSLVNPQTAIPPFIAELTGITDWMVKDQPPFADIAPQLVEFIGDAVLVAHNAQFDVRFLNYEIGRAFPGRQLANASICTVRLARRVFPGLYNYKLHTVAAHFSINIKNRHRAAGDAHATAQIFLHALERLHAHGVRDLSAARSFKAAG